MVRWGKSDAISVGTDASSGCRYGFAGVPFHATEFGRSLSYLAAAPASSPAPAPSAPSDADKAKAEDKKTEGNKKMAEKKYDEAVELYTEAIEIDSENAVYYSNRWELIVILHSELSMVNSWNNLQRRGLQPKQPARKGRLRRRKGDRN